MPLYKEQLGNPDISNLNAQIKERGLQSEL